MKIFDGILLIIIIALIFMSLVALITIHWTLYNKYSFSFLPDDINTYLTSFGQYKALFTATVTTIAAYFGLNRLKVATDANSDKLKQDRFSEWKTVLDIRFIEIEKNDPFMKREFVRVRYNLFLQIYNIDFSIKNKAQLVQIFELIFLDLVPFFEQQNEKYISKGGIYNNVLYSYSFDSFRFLFLGSVDTHYLEIMNDLETLYLAAVVSDRTMSNEKK
ncbi:hypothetical protein [Flavobacterium sp. PL02]|uniref:hypothetical protein n=1 Tax=Flavobacterium sp. PL02 TaxID=3088354 RepID=UPI002B239D46|nr:hypothetical protein [Flavobacterium sp. PL02]MEA9414314.1 hypothetical protein [Flavobacterium sp. PL02]